MNTTAEDKLRENEKLRQVLRHYVEEQIRLEAKNVNECLVKYKSTRKSPLKNFYTVSELISECRMESLEMFHLAFGIALRVNDEQIEKIDKMESAIQQISEKVGIEFSGVKNQVQELKHTVESPMLKVVADFIKKIETENERRKQAGERYVE